MILILNNFTQDYFTLFADAEDQLLEEIAKLEIIKVARSYPKYPHCLLRYCRNVLSLSEMHKRKLNGFRIKYTKIFVQINVEIHQKKKNHFSKFFFTMQTKFFVRIKEKKIILLLIKNFLFLQI